MTKLLFAALTSLILVGPSAMAQSNWDTPTGVDVIAIPSVDGNNTLPPQDDGLSIVRRPLTAPSTPNRNASRPQPPKRPTPPNTRPATQPGGPNFSDGSDGSISLVSPNPNDVVAIKEASLRRTYIGKHTYSSTCLSSTDGATNPYIQALFSHVDKDTKVCQDLFGRITYTRKSGSPIRLFLNGRNIPIGYRNKREQAEAANIFCRVIGYEGLDSANSFSAFRYENLAAGLSPANILGAFVIVPQYKGKALRLQGPRVASSIGDLEYTANAPALRQDVNFKLYRSISCGAPSPYRPFLTQAIGNKLFWNPR